jgi:hypothetical protein
VTAIHSQCSGIPGASEIQFWGWDLLPELGLKNEAVPVFQRNVSRVESAKAIISRKSREGKWGMRIRLANQANRVYPGG